jgi:AcrR family transcriptional regulator
MFLTYGIKNITMDDIARAVGASKKTLYQYFSDKETLITAVLSEIQERDIKKLETICAVSESAIHEAILISEHVTTLLSRIHPSVLFDLQKFYGTAWLTFIEHKEKIIQSCIEKNMRRGINDGTYRKDINIPILSRIRIHMIQLSLSHEVFPSDQFSLWQVQTEIIDLFTRGILSDEGLKVWELYKKKSKQFEQTAKQYDETH